MLVFAGGMVLFSEHSAFPFYYHTDEPGKVLQVIHRRKNFHHPTLLLTSANLGRKVFLDAEAEEDPQRVAELGRRVVALYAAASAGLLALLAARLYGACAGIAAGALLVTNPLLYELSHYFKEDPTLLFGIVACAWAARVHTQRRDGRSLALLGVAAGVAAAAKYVGTALLPVAAFVAASVAGSDRRVRRQQVGRVVGVALLTWLVLDYRIFRSHLLTVPRALGGELGKALVSDHGMLKQVPHAFYVGVQDEYGSFWVPALAALWLIYALYRPRKVSIAEWILAGVAVGFVAVFSFTPKVSARYYLPTSAAIGYLAAAGAFGWAALAASRWPRLRMEGHAVALLLCLGAAWQQWGDTEQIRRALQQDDRAELFALVETLPPTAVIAQDEAVGLPEPERRWQHRGRPPVAPRVLGATQAPDLGTLDELRARGVTHLALCWKTYRYYFATDKIVKDAAIVTARRTFYRTALERGRILREWKPGRVVYLQPGLVLIDISGLGATSPSRSAARS